MVIVIKEEDAVKVIKAWNIKRRINELERQIADLQRRKAELEQDLANLGIDIQ